MRHRLLTVGLMLALGASAGFAAAKTAAKKPAKKAASHEAKSKKSAHRHKVARRRGQQAILNNRIVEIQTALIREGYLKGEPTGRMDDNTRSALMSLQKARGWQTKIVPDARALIALGLGPSADGLLNPNTAAVTPTSPAPASGQSGNPQR